MVTLRAYLNLGEAILAKSHLEQAEIPCTLADENVHLYGGAPFAMPIRLVVMEQDLEKARSVLRLLENPEAIESEPDFQITSTNRLESEGTGKKNNPWEILCVALLFLVPGSLLLCQTTPLILVPPKYHVSRHYITVLSPTTVNVFGLMAVAIALSLITLYLQTRRAIRDENVRPNRGRHDHDLPVH